MTICPTPLTNAERRLAIARRLHQALVTQNPDRVITLCDAAGEVVAHHDPLLEQRKVELSEVNGTSQERRG